MRKKVKKVLPQCRRLVEKKAEKSEIEIEIDARRLHR